MVCVGTCVRRRHACQIDTYNLSMIQGICGVCFISARLGMLPMLDA